MTGESTRTIPTPGSELRSGTAGQAPRPATVPAVVARWCGVGALAAVAGTVVVFAVLHLLPATRRISPVTRTISEYALTDAAWLFNLGVLLLVAASVAVFGGLALLGRVRALGVGTLFAALWVAGLLTLVSFPKHNWALGAVSTSGQVHRLASLVAFLALPVAVLATARRRGRTGDHAAARWAFWLAVLALAWFSPLLYAVFTAPLTGTPWWQAIPLGLVERGLALTEVLATAALAVLLLRSAAAQGVSDAAPTPAR